MKHIYVRYNGETLEIDSRFAAKNGIMHGYTISSNEEFWQILRGNANFVLQEINNQLSNNCIPETDTQGKK